MLMLDFSRRNTLNRKRVLIAHEWIRMFTVMFPDDLADREHRFDQVRFAQQDRASISSFLYH